MSSVVSERSRWPPLAKVIMTPEVVLETKKELTPMQRFDRWWFLLGPGRCGWMNIDGQ